MNTFQSVKIDSDYEKELVNIHKELALCIDPIKVFHLKQKEFELKKLIKSKNNIDKYKICSKKYK